jgi:hypothetical protein
VRLAFAPARLPHHDLKRPSENLPSSRGIYDEAHLSKADRQKKGITMAFDLATMDLALSHEQPPFHDKDITIVMFQLVCVPIVEFSADQSCKHECDLIAFGNLTQRTDGRSYLQLHDASTHQDDDTVLDDAVDGRCSVTADELTGRERPGTSSIMLT